MIKYASPAREAIILEYIGKNKEYLYNLYIEKIFEPIAAIPSAISGGDVMHGGDGSNDPILGNDIINPNRMNSVALFAEVLNSLSKNTGEQEMVRAEVIKEWEKLEELQAYYICKGLFENNMGNQLVREIVEQNQEFSEDLKMAISRVKEKMVGQQQGEVEEESAEGLGEVEEPEKVEEGVSKNPGQKGSLKPNLIRLLLLV